MELLQLLLQLGDSTYGAWRSGTGFQTLKSMLERSEAAWNGFPVKYRLYLPQPKCTEQRHPKELDDSTRCVRAALYMPMLKEDAFFRFRERIGIGNAPAPQIEVHRFRVDPVDIPEYLHWHRMQLLLKAVLDWYDSTQSTSFYRVGGGVVGLDSISTVLRAINIPNSDYLRRLVGNGKLECNSRFVMNLFFATRDLGELSRVWDGVTEVTYQTIHNAMVAQARTTGWKHLIRLILDGDPSVVHPFELSS